MIELYGYKIKQRVFEGKNSLIFRALRENDQKAVIIKLLKEDYPTPEKITRFKREYQVTKELAQAGEGINNVFDFCNYENTFAIIEDDFDGTSLEEILKNRPLKLNEFLELAIRITSILGEIHDHFVIHKDINPSNIIWNPKTNQLKLIDLGICTKLSRENFELCHPKILEGTLEYISPEQTSRMNRSIDYRTDYYSLGVSFYKMLTGKLPFTSNDPMELLHFHIAKNPMPPHHLNSNIPEVLSHIILKLMQKTADERYQSAGGIIKDLKKCLTELKKKGRIDLFPIAQFDISVKFQVSEKLYGRDKEIQILLTKFDEVTHGRGQLLLVAGYSGIGKSSLIHEVHKPMVEKRGYYIAGKFDQYRRNIPYSAIVQSLNELIRQLVIEGPETIENYRQQFNERLGINLGVIVELIPSFATICPQYEKPAVLGAAETQNRFNQVLIDFFQTIALPEHPLVMFLDDLQWADASSLEFLRLLLSHFDTKHLLIIGAYRNNEVDQAHILSMALKEMQKTNISLTTITLGPLGKHEITQLLADTLHTPIDSVTGLVDLCDQKTQGNPFFLNQLLLSFYKEGLIYLSADRISWEWNILEMKKIDVTDNVIDLMTNKINKLSTHTKKILLFAACMGHRFDLKTLSMIYKKSMPETNQDLWEAMQEGLILPEDTSYKFVSDLQDYREHSQPQIQTYRFLHDRVQQAAYLLLPKEEREVIQRDIGHILLNNTPKDKIAENIFNIVNQLNVGMSLITSKEEKQQLSHLNLIAGKRAKDSTAYASAIAYLKIAKDLLPEAWWFDHYEQGLEIVKILAESLYIIGQIEAADQLIKDTLPHLKTNIEKADMQCMQVIQYSTSARMQEAIDKGLEALRLLNVNIAEYPSIFTVLKEIFLVRWYLLKKRIANLINQPMITDQRQSRIMSLLNEMRSSAYTTNHVNLIATIILRATRLALQHGTAAETADTYSGAGFVFTGLGDLKRGFEFFKLAIALNSKLNEMRYRCQIYTLYAFFCCPLNHPWQHIEEYANKAITAGLQTGELFYLSQMATNVIINNPEMPFPTLLQEMTRYSNYIAQVKYQNAWDTYSVYDCYIRNFMGLTKDRHSLSNERFNEYEAYTRMKESRYFSGVAVYELHKAIIYYLYAEYEKAWEHSQKADALIESLLNTANATEHFFYTFLTLAALYPTLSWYRKIKTWRRLKHEYHKFKKWSAYCPANFSHKKYLMEAELARLGGNELRASKLYNLAIEKAKEYRFLRIEALAYELAAKFHLQTQQTQLVKFYILEAKYAYTKLAADGRIKYLEEIYPNQLLFDKSFSLNDTISSENPKTSTTTVVSGSLDLDSVIKSSQMISSEIVLKELLKKLMKIVIENAGAEKGWLVLPSGKDWYIEAEGSIDGESDIILQSLPIKLLPTSIINSVIHTKQPIVLDAAHDSPLYAADAYIKKFQTKSVLCLPLLSHGQLDGVLYLENNLAYHVFTPSRLETLKLLASQIVISVNNARLYHELEETNRAYECFVPQDFLKLLQKKTILDVRLGDQVQREMTILFCDVCDFTTVSESLTPKETLAFINGFLKFMEPVIRKYNGFIDKYIGDAIMALFPSSPDDAVNCAREMLQALHQYNHELEKQHLSPINVGIGINTGLLVMGTVGNEKRMDGTVISDAVNIASRVEHLTRQYHTRILITKETYDKLANCAGFEVKELESVIVKGKSKPTTIYAIKEKRFES